ncbi:MAG: CpsB/CapC family capsule biosynthesis tyrosine phosphatase [Bacteroidaceae bacterium]|nr:CpsB/CapC family capsule biosynthesis tyrosine phosphatase [Bacteroidaceae bacterium]
MFCFNSKKKLIDTGIFNGATDWHSHILPGVDDGIQTMQDSLKALSYYESIGIKEVWLTPHIMEDIPNTTSELRARYEELQNEYSGTIKLHLAAENMIDNLFNERLKEKDFLPIGSKQDHLLVETSYYQPPIDLYGTLKRIQEEGYIPILAHPERYGYMSDKDYDKLSSMKVLLQMNIVSLAGGYGKPAQDKALMLLNKGYYSFIGSDLHRLRSFTEAINTKSLKKDTVSQLKRICNFIG